MAGRTAKKTEPPEDSRKPTPRGHTFKEPLRGSPACSEGLSCVASMLTTTLRDRDKSFHLRDEETKARRLQWPLLKSTGGG